MSEGPPGTLRVISILARIGMRRTLNRMLGAMRRKKKPGAMRAATPGKQQGGCAVLLFVTVIWLWQGITVGTGFVSRLVGFFERQGSQGILVRESTEEGAAASRTAHEHSALIPGVGLWPAQPHAADAVRVIGVVLLVLFAGQILFSLGNAQQDLGKVEWTMEWLFTLPAPAEAIFLAKVIEYTFTNAFGWFLTLPLLFTVFWCSGHGPSAIPLSLFATVYLLALVASARVVIETWCRKNLPLNRLKNLQGACTLVGLLVVMALFWMVMSRELPSALPAVAAQVPMAALWNPVMLPAVLAHDGGNPRMAFLLLLLFGTVLPFVAVRLCEWLVRDGLLLTSGVYQGARTRIAVGADTGGLRGIIGKESKLLLRDRNFMVQTLVVPLMMVGMQVVLNPGILHGIAGNFRGAATLAFAVGAYVLMFSSFQVLNAEGGSLWLLYTFPRGLHRMLLEKAFLWTAFACTYTLLVLVGAAAFSRRLGWEALPPAMTALAGVFIYSFIGAALGVLGSDPLETDVRRKIRPDIMYLYMFLASSFGFAVYRGTAWQCIVYVLQAGVLAGGLWQKVRDRIPFLLDPVAAPPPRVSLSDGLIAALAFFVLQAIVGMISIHAGASVGEATLIAFVVAGAVTTAVTLLIFWRRRVAGLLAEVGLSREGASQGMAALVGVLCGGAAAAFGAAYIWALRSFEPLRSLVGDLPQVSAEMRVWLGTLLVCAAPPFEEFIFRGLVFRGMRRSLGPVTAALASAAIFAIVHPPVSALPVFGLGLAAAVAFERTGLLIAPIVAHAVYNAVVIALQR